ncbi:MAG: endo-1,4-beta-xylanase [Anaerolineae bacterium]
MIWQEIDEEERSLFKARFLELFNFAVFPFYWRRYERTPGRPEWQDVLPTLAWSKANHITTKGHPLVWTAEAGIPEWLPDYPETWHKELLKARVFNTVVGFRGEIDIWDVVNEFIHLSTWAYKHVEQRAHTTEEVADFVEEPLHWAHEANPEATLVLNEFDLIPNKDTFKAFDTPPRDRFLAVIRELKRRNAPLHALGIQAHEPRDAWYAPDMVWETFDQLGELGYPLQVTEFTPRSSGNAITGGWRTGMWTEEAQADYTEQMLRLSFGHPDVVCFNFWGMPDAYAWLSDGGLVDEDYRPKPVYRRIKKLVRDEWMTRLKLQTDADGIVDFRGFYGHYDVTVKSGIHQAIFEADLMPGKQAVWTRHLGSEA